MFHYVYNGREWRDCDIEDGSESDRKRTTHGTLETTGKPGVAKTPGVWRQEDRPSSRRTRPAIYTRLARREPTDQQGSRRPPGHGGDMKTGPVAGEQDRQSIHD